MADGQFGLRTTSSWPITKIFTAFRIALDLKKLALAAAGIVATWVGWWVLCFIFYAASPTPPQWQQIENPQDPKSSWKAFKRQRNQWNLLHRLAGPPTNDPKLAIRFDEGDVAESPDEWKAFKAVLEGRKPVTFDVEKKQLLVDGGALVVAEIDVTEPADLVLLKAMEPISFAEIVVDPKVPSVALRGKTIKIKTDFDKLRQFRDDVQPFSSLSKESGDRFVKHLQNPTYKPAGEFRVSPWNENRGENPYLLAVRIVQGEDRPFVRGGFFTWLLHDQLPVLAEPIIKFIVPVLYLFHRDAGGFQNWLFLVCVTLWNLAVWGYVGGSICRLAAVQFARNEKISLSETVDFVNARAKHFFLAPIFPLACLAALSIVLGTFGLITGLTYFVGDLVIAGLLWPIMIVLGLIMAVLLVGLLAWPLMYPTIAVEGSDSFDALSRSYSYLYQAPWSFIGYAGTALAYGAALVFFVGFMGSLTVYLSQWGFNRAPFLASESPDNDRTPAYFFEHAPTSFGWRDLFLHDSVWAEKVPTVIDDVGSVARVNWQLQDKYVERISPVNRIGGWLVTLWLGLTFLLVVGFGYSYFWTASTIIYFLMRKKVDDTEFDEIYLDEDDTSPPPPPSAPKKEAAPAPKPGTVSLNVVEPPKTPGIS